MPRLEGIFDSDLQGDILNSSELSSLSGSLAPSFSSFLSFSQEMQGGARNAETRSTFRCDLPEFNASWLHGSQDSGKPGIAGPAGAYPGEPRKEGPLGPSFSPPPSLVGTSPARSGRVSRRTDGQGAVRRESRMPGPRAGPSAPRAPL